MTFRLPAVIGLCFHLCPFSISFAQSTDSVLYPPSATNLQQLYFKEIGDNAQIYHGSEFIRNGIKINGSPFFGSDSLLSGSVSYQGSLYENRNLQYNLLTDELITNNYTHTSFIALSTEKVDSFVISNQLFVRLVATKLNGLPKNKFYGLLVSGEPGLYVNRYKRFVAASGSIDAKYSAYNEYYICLKNAYYPVNGKNELLEIFADKKDEIKKYIRSNKIKFNKNLESSLVLTVIYYSRLKHLNE
jgi:hypothetical protein